MTVTPAVLVAGLVAWVCMVAAVGWRRHEHPRNILHMVSGGALVLTMLAFGEAPVALFEVKVAIAALGGALLVRGFERERHRTTLAP
jgi:hypothetical protein